MSERSSRNGHLHTFENRKSDRGGNPNKRDRANEKRSRQVRKEFIRKHPDQKDIIQALPAWAFLGKDPQAVVARLLAGTVTDQSS